MLNFILFKKIFEIKFSSNIKFLEKFEIFFFWKSAILLAKKANKKNKKNYASWQ
jgi:hypothetical protein